jgi:hypothetical protein
MIMVNPHQSWFRSSLLMAKMMPGRMPFFGRIRSVPPRCSRVQDVH